MTTEIDTLEKKVKDKLFINAMVLHLNENKLKYVVEDSPYNCDEQHVIELIEHYKGKVTAFEEVLKLIR